MRKFLHSLGTIASIVLAAEAYSKTQCSSSWHWLLWLFFWEAAAAVNLLGLIEGASHDHETP